MTKKIITIEPAKILRSSELPSLKKRKVAGYARVSTDRDDQASSYESQMKYYTDYIGSRSDWEFVKMYSDEGISGTNTKKRLGFQEMVEDALNGKIDLILTKSVSRFARNTVDSLTTVRKLKEVGVEIYFEKENIWTLDSKGELLITIMSSLAQEESRSISENIKWSKRKMAAEGAVSFGYAHVLGFKVAENGGFDIDEDEAKIVRYIFGLFLQGENPNSIARILTEKGIPTPAGKKLWSYSTVKSMLQNEKYKGDALLQKSFTVDYLTKQKKKNEGELPQYYVENNHRAIIDKATFDLVQLELQKTHNRNKVSFCGKVICGCCGNPYGRHVWHSNSKHRRHIYRCNKKYKGEQKCDSPSVSEEEIQGWSVEVINQVIGNKNDIINNMKLLIKMLENTDKLTETIKNLEREMADIGEQAEKMVERNAKVIQNQEMYQAEYDRLVTRYEELQSLLLEKQSTLQLKRKQSADVKLFVDLLAKQEHMVTAFDEKLFNTLIEKMVIYKNKKVAVHFKNGQVIEI
ncbi:recombinase family protein [Streptococcus ictaluri]|uniref:Recombinase n=1 Tax=Streptococcus ictaluri 707-05 TaxID=764299 RepID=G5K234_9STRE|nr:recombinase family protein [Streptococcus ictaluri]EHI69948.1 recombinase [Streptococcus ictaluri 707-05]QBX16591.1 site-specific recombinase [Streptococcus phage Javan261]